LSAERNKIDKKFIDGRWWTYGTYVDWRDLNFPFWSANTIGRIFRKLEKDGYLLSRKPEANDWNQTKWYTIEYTKLVQSEIPTWNDGSSQVGTILNETETSPETSPDIKESAPIGAPPTGANGIVIFGERKEYAETPAPISPEQQMIAGFYSKPAMMDKWYEWEAYRVERKKKLTPTTRNKQIKFLLDQGEDAIAIMEQSMTAGWLGLFPLKQNGHAPKPTQPVQYTEEH
jgi:hypothetical protein